MKNMKGFSRFFQLRERLFRLIEAVDEGYHKSYEGALDVCLSFPPVFESNGNPEPPELVKIELHCYLLCSGRHDEFVGKSFEECMDKFEGWIKKKEARLLPTESDGELV